MTISRGNLALLLLQEISGQSVALTMFESLIGVRIEPGGTCQVQVNLRKRVDAHGGLRRRNVFEVKVRFS